MSKTVRVLWIYILFILGSCSSIGVLHSKNNTKESNLNSEILNHKLSSAADSISYQLWNSYDASNYFFLYSNESGLVFKRADQLSYQKVESEEIVEEFVRLSNIFFIEKTEAIIQNKIATDYIEYADYSKVTVKVFRNESLLDSQKIRMGDPQFKVTFNPKFLELVELMSKIIK